MEQRVEFVLRAQRTENFRALCQEYGISAKTGYKWQERFLRLGLGGMEEESRRPHHHAEELGEGEVCAIIRLKLAHPRWGPRKIRELYLRRHGKVASESSFKRVLERAGLTEQRKGRRVVIEGGRLSSGRKAEKLNEVWTVDFKGWWRTQEGRCEPLTVRDELSRYILELRAMEDARSQSVRRSFEGLFERHGLPEAIRSDNGSPFASVQSVHGLSRRRVDKNGYLSWQDQRLFLSGSLAGWSVGLKAAGGELIEVWFVKLLLGHIDQKNLSFLRADIPQKAVGQEILVAEAA
jgi:transposase InsO family protein